MEIIISINFLAYLFTSIYYYKRYGLTIFTSLWIYFTIFAGMAVFCIVTGLYYERFFHLSPNYDKVTIEPYVFSYVINFLLLYPLKYIKGTERFLCERFDFAKINVLIKILTIFFFIFIGVKLFVYLKYSHLSLLERRIMSVSGEPFIDRNSQPYLWLFDYFMGILHSAITPIFLLICFKKLTLKQIKPSKLFYYIGLVLAGPLIGYMMASNRSGLVFSFVNIIYFFILFISKLDKSFIKRICVNAAILVIPLIIILSLITQERYENSSISSETGVLTYFGESFVNMGVFVYYDLMRNSMGFMFFPDWMYLFSGFSYSIDVGLVNYYEFWSSFTGINSFIFKTLSGGLFIEFGVVGALFFMFILSSVITIFIRNTKVPSIAYYSIIFIYFTFCTNCVLDFAPMFGRFYIVRIIFLIIIITYFLRRLTLMK